MNRRPPDAIFTLEQLPHWSFDGTALAVLGHPIGHSVSPPMHNAALAEFARSDGSYAAWRYFRFDVPPERLSEALPRLHAAGFHGLNLTVPHKVLAFDLVQEIDGSAVAAGAVNTLQRTAGGWRGCNTDGPGLAAAVQEAFGLSLAGAHVILLGAGGAARAAAVECVRRQCASLAIANRTRARLEALLGQLPAGVTPRRGFDPAHPPADLPDGALLINATSLGLAAADPAPIELPRLPANLRVFDMIYNPPQTRLLREAAARGLPHANGLGMLVHQGARALEIWTGRPAPVATMRRAAQAALAGPTP